MDCLFCKIVKGDIPSHKVYEDKNTFAFLDISPRAPGHAVVLPKLHAENLLALPDKEIAPLFKAVKKVTQKVFNAMKPDGFTLGINHGKVSGQTIDHLHFHIIPRWFSDKGGSIHSVVNNPPKESLEEIAKIINA